MSDRDPEREGSHQYSLRSRHVEVPDLTHEDPPHVARRRRRVVSGVSPQIRYPHVEYRRRRRISEAQAEEMDLTNEVIDTANAFREAMRGFPLLSSMIMELQRRWLQYIETGYVDDLREMRDRLSMIFDHPIWEDIMRLSGFFYDILRDYGEVMRINNHNLYLRFAAWNTTLRNRLGEVDDYGQLVALLQLYVDEGERLRTLFNAFREGIEQQGEGDGERQDDEEEEDEERHADTLQASANYVADYIGEGDDVYRQRRQSEFANGERSLRGGPRSFFRSNEEALDYMEGTSAWRVFFQPLFTHTRVFNHGVRPPSIGPAPNALFLGGDGAFGVEDRDFNQGHVIPGTRAPEWEWMFQRLGLGDRFLMPENFNVRVTQENEGAIVPAYIAVMLRSALERGERGEQGGVGGQTHIRLSMAFGHERREVENTNGNRPASYLLRATNAYPVFHRDDSLQVGSMSIEQFARVCAEAESLIVPPQQGVDGERPSGLNLGINSEWWLRFMIWTSDGAYIAGTWSPELEEEIKKRCGRRALYFPRNVDDNFCFEYSVLSGLIKLFSTCGFDYFQRNADPESGGYDVKVMLELAPHMSFAEDKIRDFIEKVRSMVFNDGERMFNHGEDCDLESITFEEMRKSVDNFSEKYLPPNVGIDIFVLDNKRKHKHIFPCYQAHGKRASKGSYVIPILCFMTSEGKAHYCLIRDVRRFFQNNEGRIFFSCSRCRRTFITRRQLVSHICTEDPLLGESAYDVITEMPCVGVCWKCLLQFRSDEEYDMHVRCCFMKGRTGYRHVELIEAPKNESLTFKPKLLCERNELQVEKKKMEKELMYFGDFESSIDPDSGLHEIMSFGMYCENKKRFVIGKTIEQMFKLITEDAEELGVKCARIFFHNSMNYDSNFIFKWLTESETSRSWKIDGVMKNINKFQQLRITTDKKVVIIIGDTFQFLTLSLEGLVESVKSKSGDVHENMAVFPRFFSIMQGFMPQLHLDSLNKILKKNPFPYTWFETSEQLQIPFEMFLYAFENPKYFKAGTNLVDAREHAKWVGETFGLKTAGDYHDIYLACDVLQLADIFMHAEKVFMETHKVILRNYVGMPSATWHAFLRNTPDLDLPLYRSAHEALFFKAMTRGGVTCASTRYAEADGKTSSIIYLDVNGLYPYVMRQKYPCKYLTLWNTKECEGEYAEHFIRNLTDQCEKEGTGFCVEVDLEYPKEIHDLTDDYPLAPEHKVLKGNDYAASVYLQEWMEEHEGEQPPHFEGLVGTLFDKEHYCVHWRILLWYLKMGMKVKKVYTVVKFEESAYLAPYVEKNISLRNQRTDAMGKMVYKLAGNALYGKTFENPFNHGKCVIVRDRDTFAHLMDNGTISQIGYMNGETTVIKMDGEKVVLDKPTYIGPIVTEYAKLHMYKLFYEDIMGIFGRENMKLLYTDTDSFIIYIKHPESVTSTKELFAYIKERKPDLIGPIGGQVKSETGMEFGIKRYIGLRAKSYYYETEDGHICKKSKGTTHDAQDGLTYEDYARALFEKQVVNCTNLVFKRTGFSVSTIESERRALSSNDGKRIILEDGISTHALGYAGSAGDSDHLYSSSPSSISSLN